MTITTWRYLVKQPANPEGGATTHDVHLEEVGLLIDVNEAPLKAGGVERDDVVGKPIADTYWWSDSEEAQEKVRDAMNRAARGETVRFVNIYFERLTGYQGREIQDRDWFSTFLTEGDRATIRDLFKRAVDNQAAVGNINPIVTRSGETRDIEWYDRVLHEQTGEATGLLVVGLGVTERKQAEEQILRSLSEEVVLLQEIHHRVKNNLAIVAELLNMQSGAVSDPALRSALLESQNRVHSMALIHEMLPRSQELSAVDMRSYSERLCRQVFDSYDIDPGRIQLTTNVEDVSLDLNQAVPFSLILNELVSNSLKHAFPHGRSGNVAVTIRKGSEDDVLLTVDDDGIGIGAGIDPGDTRSLGLRLVETLSRQLRARIVVDGTAGTHVSITIPRASEHEAVP